MSSKPRGKIEALHSVGHSVLQIAAFVRRSRNSVYQCLQRLSHGSSDYEKRPGREKATTIREDHRLKRMALQNRPAPSRLLSYQLADETGKQVSSTTVRRRLSETGVNARRPRKNPLLTENHRRLRLGWATTHTQWTLDDWKSVLFTDESKVSIGNDGALYVWRRKGEEFLPECCNRTVQHAASVRIDVLAWFGVSGETGRSFGQHGVPTGSGRAHAYRRSGIDRRRLCLPAEQRANPYVSVNKTMASQT